MLIGLTMGAYAKPDGVSIGCDEPKRNRGLLSRLGRLGVERIGLNIMGGIGCMLPVDCFCTVIRLTVGRSIQYLSFIWRYQLEWTLILVLLHTLTGLVTPLAVGAAIGTLV